MKTDLELPDTLNKKIVKLPLNMQKVIPPRYYDNFEKYYNHLYKLNKLLKIDKKLNKYKLDGDYHKYYQKRRNDINFGRVRKLMTDNGDILFIISKKIFQSNI